MPVELKSLLAIIPVDASKLVDMIKEYELMNEPISAHFKEFTINSTKFTEQVVCFLTTCDLYDEPEYQVILSQWSSYIAPFLESSAIKRYYAYLLQDAKTLSLSSHYEQRLTNLLTIIG